MVDPTPPPDRPRTSVCPWCSAAVDPGAGDLPVVRRDPRSEEERDVPGVTAVDATICAARSDAGPLAEPAPVLDQRRVPGGAPRRRQSAQALAPPDPEVQREILRLELEAEVANLQAEADALLSEAVVEGRVAELPEERPGSSPPASSTPRRSPAATAGEDDGCRRRRRAG